jgi:hypothetical protein
LPPWIVSPKIPIYQSRTKLEFVPMRAWCSGVEFVKMSAQLPLVDPKFRLVERRPERLHAYARGLLQHLRGIRAGGKAEGYPIATIKAAAVWLIKSYADAVVAPAPEAALLVSEIVRPRRDASTSPVRRSSEPAYWAAIEFEAGHPPDPTGKEPSVAKRYAVAKYVLGLLKNKSASQKTAEGIVRGWRKLPHYRENVALQRPTALRVKT